MAEALVKVRSADGTVIAAAKSGKGPPLVLVHGASADRARWKPLLPHLEAAFTCYAMDRRGRGASGDGPAYALAREAEDIVAVCAGAGAGVSVFGHSYGGLAALAAAPRIAGLRRLVLYEATSPPPVGGRNPLYPPGVHERLQALLDAGDREGLVEALMREVAQASDEDIAVLRSRPSWPARLATAPTLPRELRADDAWRLDPRAVGSVGVPTLLLLGGASPPEQRAAADALLAALPDGRIAVLPGQGHAAIDTGTELVARELLRFLA